MLDKKLILSGFKRIRNKMVANKEYLIKLDQRNGDGDLGISMVNGFSAVCDVLMKLEERDLGKVFLQCSKAFNKAAPSSLGTILSIGLMGMAKRLKGLEVCELSDLAGALESGMQLIKEKAGSKEGEKTIIDAFVPAIRILGECSEKSVGYKETFVLAAEKAAKGAESTKNMRAVHGRAAYFADASIGLIDGGAVAGKLIFEALAE